jgi:hypothetical protein
LGRIAAGPSKDFEKTAEIPVSTRRSIFSKSLVRAGGTRRTQRSVTSEEAYDDSVFAKAEERFRKRSENRLKAQAQAQAQALGFTLAPTAL